MSDIKDKSNHKDKKDEPVKTILTKQLLSKYESTKNLINNNNYNNKHHNLSITNSNTKLNESSILNKSDASLSVRNNLNSNYKKSAYYRINKDTSILSVKNQDENDNVPRLDLSQVTNMRAKLNESMRSDIQKH